MARELGLVLLVLRKDDADVLPDAFGCYIGKSTPVEVEEGVSWRDALADARATINALEDALASLGYEARYCDDVEQVAEYDEVQSLTVNGEPWDLQR